jgi:hypothetical protein
MSFMKYLSPVYWFYTRPNEQQFDTDIDNKMAQSLGAGTVLGKTVRETELQQLMADRKEFEKKSFRYTSIERGIEWGLIGLLWFTGALGDCGDGSARVKLARGEDGTFYEWTFPANDLMELEKIQKSRDLGGYFLTFRDVPDVPAPGVPFKREDRPLRRIFVEGLDDAGARRKYVVGTNYIVPKGKVDGSIYARGPRGTGVVDYWVVPNDSIESR